MNIYLFTFLELVLYGCLAYFIGRNLDSFVENDNITNLNYMFWGIFALLSLLANLQLYLYFGSALAISVIILIIFIYKQVTVQYFVDKEMTIYFWILFGIFMMTVALLTITKKMLLLALRSEAPRGPSGAKGEIGPRGESYFVESVSDRAYVYIVKELEKYFVEILDKNDIEFNRHEYQFNNQYIKEAINRIVHSQQFICKLINKDKEESGEYECKYDTYSIDRQCRKKSDIYTTKPSYTGHLRWSNGSAVRYLSWSDGYDKLSDHSGLLDMKWAVWSNVKDTAVNVTPEYPVCKTDSDCTYLETSEKKNNLVEGFDIETECNDLIKEFKEWFKLILRNNCEENRKLREKLKYNKYIKLEVVGIENDNPLKLNNVFGRRFLQSYFENDQFWKNNNLDAVNNFNPFLGTKSNGIHYRPTWKWGTAEGAKGGCDLKEPLSETCNF